MTDEKHQVVITADGELVAADDAMLALESHDDPPVEPSGAAPPVGDVAVEGTRRDASAPPRSAELVTFEPAFDPIHMRLGDISKVGKVFAQSGFFKDSRDAAQAVVKIMAGQELGVGPFQSMSGFHIVDGKPVMSAGLIGALVKRSGKYDYRVAGATDDACVLLWYQGEEEVGQSSFSMEDAKRAKLVRTGSGWEKYPADMLFARALSRGARRFCPDVFGGAIYTDEELT